MRYTNPPLQNTEGTIKLVIFPEVDISAPPVITAGTVVPSVNTSFPPQFTVEYP